MDSFYFKTKMSTLIEQKNGRQLYADARYTSEKLIRGSPSRLLKNPDVEVWSRLDNPVQAVAEHHAKVDSVARGSTSPDHVMS